MHQDATAEIARRDKPLLDGLTKAGFKLNSGPDDSGLFNTYFQVFTIPSCPSNGYVSNHCNSVVAGTTSTSAPPN